jgi:hypothetical protein
MLEDPDGAGAGLLPIAGYFRNADRWGWPLAGLQRQGRHKLKSSPAVLAIGQYSVLTADPRDA